MKNLASEQKMIRKILLNEKLAEYIKGNLKQSLKSVGFSKGLIDDLVDNLEYLKINKFQKKYSEELKKVYTINFFQKIVPAYFEKYVIPEISNSKKFLDIGCGTGILLKRLSGKRKFEKLMGIDIIKYPEWKIFNKNNISFKIVEEKDFPLFLKKYEPNLLAITWTFHHMERVQHKKYLKSIFSNIKKDTKIIILEDAYSERTLPEKGHMLHKKFMHWGKKDRKKIMSVYDWIANRILAQRKKVNIPFAFRTLEEWTKLFGEVGFKYVSQKFIGFPEKRDINTPQGLIVVKK